MGIAVQVAASFMISEKNNTLSGLIGGVAGSIAVGLCIYGTGSYMANRPELSRVLVEAGKGIGKK
jgi:hypothetical protein